MRSIFLNLIGFLYNFRKQDHILKMQKSPLKEGSSSSPSTDKPSKLKKPAYFQMIEYPHNTICEQLTFMLIRPPRFVYNPEILKPNKRNQKRFTAETIDIGFQLTFYKQKEMKYVVLYLHGNGSSRFEGNLFLHSLPDQVGLACFDFSGCGIREDADYITLGQNQCRDVDKAARYLKGQGYTVVGWGRSMGAVSLLKSQECDIMVADSAYSDLTHLCKESSSKFVPRACCCFFHMFFPCIFSCLKCKVESMSGLKIEAMDIVDRLKKMDIQKKEICFIHGEEDTLIPKDHSQRLYNEFKGRKLVICFQGTHNSSRPDEVISKCFKFIEDGLTGQKGVSSRVPENLKLSKLIEMEEFSDGFPREKMIEASTKTIKVSRSSDQSERDMTNANLHSEYSSGPLEKQGKLFPEIKEEEDYCEAGQKIEITMRDRGKKGTIPPSFKSATTFEASSVNNDLSPVGSSKKQEEVFRKIFKQQ